MKTICIFSMALLACVLPLFGGSSLSPEDVVRAAIKAAQEDSLSAFVTHCDIPAISRRGRHAMTAVAMIAFLKEIKAEDVTFEPVVADKDSNRVTVRMAAPIRSDFELVKWKESKGREWRIVGVHP